MAVAVAVAACLPACLPAGFAANHQDISSRYAAVLFGECSPAVLLDVWIHLSHHAHSVSARNVLQPPHFMFITPAVLLGVSTAPCKDVAAPS
jgi:hypothetical protein